jgi:hypothetical protein
MTTLLINPASCRRSRKAYSCWIVIWLLACISIQLDWAEPGLDGKRKKS